MQECSSCARLSLRIGHLARVQGDVRGGVYGTIIACIAHVQDYCRAKLGKLDSAIQPRSFQEVKAHNAAGQCWLALDGEQILCCR